MKPIERVLSTRLASYASYFPVVAVLGPRQCGKTTLSKMWRAESPDAVYLDLERPSDQARLANPEDFLRRQRGKTVCLDEIQRVPELFPVLRALCDETDEPGQFLVLGSASPELLRQSSETLAGRIGYLELTPLLEEEVGIPNRDTLWMRGGFPRSYLAPTEKLSLAWRENFVATFLERDLPQLGVHTPATTLRRFWQMCAHLHGELWNHAKVASSLGVTGKTVAHYLELFEQAFMLRQLQPFEANVKKRLVKSPRVYLRDTGILHSLLGVPDRNGLDGHPVLGGSWESYVIEQLAGAFPSAKLFFYRTAAGAEMDLVIRLGGQTHCVEMKASSAPIVTRGFWHAIEDIQPASTWVASPVDEAFTLREGVMVAAPGMIIQALGSVGTDDLST